MLFLLSLSALAADPVADAWGDAMLGGVTFGTTTGAQLVAKLGPPVQTYQHTPTSQVHVYEGGSVPGVPGAVRRFFLVEADKVMGMRFDSGGKVVRDPVVAALAAWKPLPVPGDKPMDAVCALPKDPGAGLLLAWAPDGALTEGVFGPTTRWTMPFNPCPKASP